jgi:NADH:ubiquinone oxidoreductase subunit D
MKIQTNRQLAKVMASSNPYDSAKLYNDSTGISYTVDFRYPQSFYEMFDDLADRSFANQFVDAYMSFMYRFEELREMMQDIQSGLEEMRFDLRELAKATPKMSVNEIASEINDINGYLADDGDIMEDLNAINKEIL